MLDPPPPASPSNKTPRRILLLSRGGALDGEQRQLCLLAANLDRCLYEPCVILDHDGPCAAELRRHKVELAILPTRDTRRFPALLLRSLDARRALQQARDWNVHLVHASNRWKSYYALFIARHMKIPSVMHVRGPMSRRDVKKHGFQHASAILAISQRYHENLGEMQLDLPHVHVVDDAIDPVSFSPDAQGRQRVRQEWNLGPQLAIGLVGRIEPFKKTIEFLHALAHLPPSLSAMGLIIGDPGSTHYLRQVHRAIAQLGLEDRVRFLGRRHDMRQVLSALDLLVSLSGGSVLFEAMACGTPVLSARDHPQPPVHARHNETAWCIQSQDPRKIAQSIHHLLADPALRQRLGQAASAWAATHLSAVALASATQTAYAKALGICASST